ncbi:MAG: hypothetical protein ACHP84_07995 [Caulobacterales bacterium]
MPSLMDTLSQLDGKAELTADDALTMRRSIFGSDIEVTTEDAEALIKLNMDAGAASPEWRMLYVEALTDFVVRQQAPAGYVDQAKAAWLMSALSRNGCGKADEMELLVHVLEEADEAPPELCAFTLKALRGMLLARKGDNGARPAIGRDDVELLRRAVFAAGGEGAIAVTREEAETLFDINDAFRGATNDPTWTDFFVKALANSLLYAPSFTEEDAPEALRRQNWLTDTSVHPLHFLSGRPDIAGAVHSAFDHTPAIFEAWQEKNAADDVVEASAQAVTGEEAHWLAGRLGHGGALDPNEQALLRFLADNASSMDPSLQPLLAQASGRPATAPASAKPEPAAHAEDRPVFGHRMQAPAAE